MSASSLYYNALTPLQLGFGFLCIVLFLVYIAYLLSKKESRKDLFIFTFVMTLILSVSFLIIFATLTLPEKFEDIKDNYVVFASDTPTAEAHWVLMYTHFRLI